MFIVEPQLIGDFEGSLIDHEIASVAAGGDEDEFSVGKFLEGFSQCHVASPILSINSVFMR